MKISVVIPVFNEEKYIDNCLQSLHQQEEKADEIIIVNNNCTDRTIDIAKKYKVKIIKEKKQGTIFARNTGFNTAKYEIIARCDADTILPENWIKKIKENFSKRNIDGLTGPASFYDLPFPTLFFTIIYLKGMKILQKGKHTLIGPNMAITKTVWNKIKNQTCVDEKKVHEDIDLAIHISQIGGKIYLDDNLAVKISARRIKNNPFSFFIEYPTRLAKTLKLHSL